MKATLRRLLSVALLVFALAVLCGPAAASADAQPPVPGPIPSPVGGIGGELGIEFPTCMIDPVTCFISGVVAQLGANAAEIVETILNEVASEATFNPGAPGFLQQYSLGFGIAIFVLCVLLMRLFYKMSRHPERMPQYRESLMHHLPLGLVMCVAAPGLGALLADMSNGLTDGIIGATSSPDELVGSVQNTITGLQQAPTPIISILLLLALILAAVMVVVTLLLQSLALYLTGSVMAIAFVMTIDPALREKASRLPMTWLGILLAKPLLFFMMGTAVQLVSAGGMASDPIVSALLAIVALLMVSLAPLTLRKFAPIIPGGGDATASGAPGAMVGGGADMASTVSQQQLAKTNAAAMSSGAASNQVQIGAQRAGSGPAGQPSLSVAPSGGQHQSGGGQGDSPMRQFLDSTASRASAPSGPGSGQALSMAKLGGSGAAGSGAAGAGAAGVGAATGLAAVAAPLGLAAVGVKAAKDFVESAAPNVSGSE